MLRSRLNRRAASRQQEDRLVQLASASVFRVAFERVLFWGSWSAGERHGHGSVGTGPTEKRSDARSIGKSNRDLLAKSPSRTLPPPPALSRPPPYKSRSAAISFIVQLVISAAITLLNTFNRQKIGSGSHRSRCSRGGEVPPGLNLVRENGVSYPPSAGRVSLLAIR